MKETKGVDRVRTLLLLHELSRTGAPKIAIEAFGSLQDRMETMAVSLEDGVMADQVRAFAPLYILPQPVYGNSDGNSDKTPRSIVVRLQRRLERRAWRKRFAAWQPDLIYVNSVASLPIVHRIPLPDAPVLLHVHELDMLIAWYERADPLLLRAWPKRYIAVADAVHEVLVTRCGIDPGKIARIPEFFDGDGVERFIASLHASPAQAELADRPFVLGGAGRIQWRKGFELWLQTAAYLQERLGPERVRFLWVGGEDDMREYEMRTTARKLGVEERLTIVPMTPEPFPHYGKFDAFLITSWEDPFPIVVLEVMAIGKPVVCVRGSGGPAEQVADTGLVVDRFDSKMLGEALLELADDPARCKRLGEASRVRAMSRFTASAVAPQIWAEIERTVREAGPTDRKSV